MTDKISPEANEFWQAYLETLAPEERPSNFTAWAFGNTPEVADELGTLVRRGTKTATASLVYWYENGHEAYPKIGDYSVILDGEGQPQCIIKVTALQKRYFHKVSAEHAYLEGEGDRSLPHWREVHLRFFEGEMKAIDKEFDEDMEILCERFELVFP